MNPTKIKKFAVVKKDAGSVNTQNISVTKEFYSSHIASVPHYNIHGGLLNVLRWFNVHIR